VANSDRRWALIVPVHGLYLTEIVNREFRVDRVLFVHRDKLPYVRKRLGFGIRVSELKKETPAGNEFFEIQPAYAVVRGTGTQEEVEQQLLELVREELSLLTLSQLGYSSRRQMGPIVPAVGARRAGMIYMVCRLSDMTGRLILRPKGPTSDMRIDKLWKDHQDRTFFTKLLKILRGETKVSGSWRKELRRASVLLGESVGSDDPFKSFLWNMVALEMLLTRNEKGEMREILPKKVEALIGWSPFWQEGGYEERIRDAYDKRNRLLHQGRRDEVTAQDLAFLDHILVNVLANLVSLPKLFRSKDDVLAFPKRLEAERILGVRRPRSRPKRHFKEPVDPDF
jgi:hypothetical protein